MQEKYNGYKESKSGDFGKKNILTTILRIISIQQVVISNVFHFLFSSFDFTMNYSQHISQHEVRDKIRIFVLYFVYYTLYVKNNMCFIIVVLIYDGINY